MRKTYADFFAAIRARESSGDYGVVSRFGYLGAYQFGEAALVDLGLAVRDANPFNNDFSKGFTGKFGVETRAEFLASKTAQDSAAAEWWNLLWNRIRFNDIEIYDQQTLNGVKLTKTGMVAASHLLGTGALIDFIESGGTDVGNDALGTTITDYIKLFAGYATPASFVNNLGKDNVITGGGRNDQLNGFAGNDTLSGGAGNDKLWGGAGGDSLSSGSGADRFVYRSAQEGGDRIADFGGSDFFIFEGANFGFGKYFGLLRQANFHSGSSNRAVDATDRFIYRKTDDTLWFDANGSAAGGLALIADLKVDFQLAAGDIWIL
jgi:serralysin